MNLLLSISVCSLRAMGSWASATASINDGTGRGNPNTQLYTNTQVNRGFQPQSPMNIGGRNGNLPVYSGGYDGLNYPTYDGNSQHR